jgi:hypothetical protein
VAIRNRQDDLFVSRWIAAEAIHYLRHSGKLDWNFSGRFDYVGLTTKIHKIIYNIAEKNDIPITRSWYMHGAFIHNYRTFAHAEFNSFLKQYLSSKYGPVKYRAIVGRLGINTDEVLNDIRRVSDFTSEMTTDQLLHYLYDKEAPSPYRRSYLAKFNLTCLNSGFNRILTYGPHGDRHSADVTDAIEKLYDDINEFEVAVFGTIEDRPLEDNTINFFDLVSDALRKTELNAKKGTTGTGGIGNSFFKIISDDIVSLVWKPYACEFTNQTAVGIGRDNAINNSKRWKKEVMASFDTEISRIRQMQYEDRLYMNWMETREYNRSRKNLELDQNLDRLISLCDNAPENAVDV